MPLLSLLAAIMLVLLGRAAPAPEPGIDDLAFLTGAWAGEADGESMREVWDPARGDSMVGHFSIFAEDRAVLYELLAIERTESGLALRIRHFGPGLTPWAGEADGAMSMTLTDAERTPGGQRAVFEDPARDFPRRIIYELTGQHLTVTLQPAAGSDREPIVIELARATDEPVVRKN